MKKEHFAYHYTTPKNWKLIQKNKKLFRGKPFRRRHKGAKYLPLEASQNVIESLLEPFPSGWVKNPHFRELWEKFINSFLRKEKRLKKLTLLKLTLSPKDNAYVVERAFMERYYSSKSKGSIEEAVRKYWHSRIKIKDYRGNYEIPQVVIWNDIPIKRIKKVWTKDVKKLIYYGKVYDKS